MKKKMVLPFFTIFFLTAFCHFSIIFFAGRHFCQKKKWKKNGDVKKKVVDAKNGKKKYMKFFNSNIVCEFIINKTFQVEYKKNKFLWEK